jgi:cell division protein FtsW
LPSTAVMLVTVVVVLNVIGAVMVLSASSVPSLTNYGNPWYFFLRHLMWTAVGVGVFVVGMRVDHRRWRRFVTPMLIAATVGLVLVLVPGFGVHVAGARRWLGYGPVRFQPSELAKLALLLYGADLFSRRGHEVEDWRRVLQPVLVVLCVFGVLVMREPDLGSTLVLGLIAGAIVVAGGARGRHLGVLAASATALVTLLAFAAPYRRARMLTFLDPFADPTNTGYQISQSFIALGSGGWTGLGLGAGRAKWNFLPNAHTDFIFAVIGEELGLLGALAVLGLFAAFAVLGTRIAIMARDPFAALLAAGITAWVVGQAVINIGAVVGLLPISGIPLPFVSFGGSALVVCMFATGVLANVARQPR